MQLVKIGKKKKKKKKGQPFTICFCCQIPLLVHCFLLNAAL